MASRRQSTIGLRTILLCGLALTGHAQAQDRSVSIELNDAANVATACRLVFVAVNNSRVVLDKASYAVVTFDAAGKVGQSLTFQFGRLPVGKTKVVQFDLPAVKCEDISRLLVNDVAECSVDGKPSMVCLDRIATSTRTKITFGL